MFGFCVANDVSQRDLQRAHGGQWLKGKSIVQTMPLGPWITTTDEVDDPYRPRIQCEVNGELLQDASTKHGHACRWPEHFEQEGSSRRRPPRTVA